jgi:Ca2+:H+ antiporter
MPAARVRGGSVGVPRWLYGLLLSGVAALIAELLGAPELLVFVLAALGIVPVSGVIGQSTEQLAHHVGPKGGGLLNATFGNAAELIIGIAALNAGLIPLVKASITGSIIGNLLLVLGAGLLVGSLKHGSLKFDENEASRNAVMMMLALAGLLLPATFAIADPDVGDIDHVSIAIACILIGMYVAYIAFSLTLKNAAPHGGEPVEPAAEGAAWSVRKALIALVAATAATVVLAELLVGTVEHVSEQFSLSEFFVGIIIVPIIGNVAEHFSAVQLAAKNKPDITLAIAAGSSTQVALLVAPIFVLVSYLFSPHMNLVFTPLELVVLLFAAFLFAFISFDGESNWLEATQLLGLYAMAGIVFYFLPS